MSHSGPDASGELIHSLNLTDVQTGWVETRAVMGRGESGVVEAIEEIRQSVPFRLQGIDSDNGSEFINHHLYRYCQRHRIQFTRGRPYKKDDNAHIEQKNWTHVRKIFGWDRYDTVPGARCHEPALSGEIALDDEPVSVLSQAAQRRGVCDIEVGFVIFLFFWYNICSIIYYIQ